MKERVNELLKNLKSFEEIVKVLNKIPADKGGAEIRGLILDYMEETYPVEFEEWL